MKKLQLEKDDRILVLAPHPDDESIGCGGLMQKALAKNLPLHVVYYTNGDNNELAFIVYEKHLVHKPEEFIHMGEVRWQEATTAMKRLGLGPENLTFLGYPDFATMPILERHWGDALPHKSMLTRVSHVPYPECQSPGAPYSGESILADLKKVLLDFKPTKVFVTLPVDFNPDHRTLPIFLQVALWELGGELPAPEIIHYVIHVVKWPWPRGYHPDHELAVPENLQSSDIEWLRLDLTDKEVKKKQYMISSYESQIEYEPDYLVTFARKNELFGAYPVLEPARITHGEIDWETEKEISSLTGHVIKPEDAGAEHIGMLTFVRDDEYLYFRVLLNHVLTKVAGIWVLLLGYKKDCLFAAMPKIRITLSLLEKMKIHNKHDEISVDGALCRFDEKKVFVRIPLGALGDPTHIFACARTHIKDLPFDKTAWRILKME